MRLKKYLWPKKSKTLCWYIIILTILSILLSLGLFYIENQINDSNFEYLELARVTDRFVSKNDVVSSYGDKTPPQPLMQQTFQYFLALKTKLEGVASTTAYFCSIAKNSTSTPYNMAIHVELIDDANQKLIKLIGDSHWWVRLGNKITISLVMLQLITALYSFKLGLGDTDMIKENANSNESPSDSDKPKE